MQKLLRTIFFLSTAVIGVVCAIHSLQFLSQGIFWDLGIYEKAVNAFNAGSNPYELSGYLSFVYQPLVLRFMALFGSSLGAVLMVFYLLSTLFFLKSLGMNRTWWFYSFLAFAYCGIGTISIGSGNITVFLHLILIGLLLNAISDEQKGVGGISGRNIPFIAIVAFVSLIKPYMLAYLLIPLVSTWKSQNQKSIWSLTVITGSLLVLSFVLSSLYFGAEFQSFLSAVQGQTLAKRDLGYGLVMYFYEYYLSAGPLIYRAFVLHFAILAAILLATLFLAKRSNLLNKPSFALLLYFLLTILNPRLKVYDLFPALITLFIFSSLVQRSILSKCLFAIAYALSLSQLVGTPLFAHTGILSDPLNVYYLTMGLVFGGSLPGLLQKQAPTLKN